ncbi:MULTISPECIES: aminodeoxychorismate synthase component I [unclassified Thioalkalivibrio]|uniref:aminodeoxychorismate synthase component I n=1 Tax=unclassified Thioalkalivibrio TaxID=2621013 RepID=UPI000374382D|nr:MULTISPECIES: aminodeoxychorismate synthase component I [unclassified Thioalkalivibrio]
MAVHRLAAGVDFAALARRFPERYPHLLESALIGQAPARFSILFAFPGRTLSTATGDDVLEALDQDLSGSPVLAPDDADHAHLPFLGGWFLYAGYELAWRLEPALGKCRSDPWLPDALVTYFPAALIHDHHEGSTWFVDETNDAERRAQVERDCAEARENMEAASRSLPDLALREEDPVQYRGAVLRGLEYIRAGDTFQVNLSREWHATSDEPLDPAVLYARLRQANAAPFAAWLQLPGAHVISSSPERLVSVEAGEVETRPIAGTRRRDADVEEDKRLFSELTFNLKERAEHVMLVDLERNDVGRIAETGSVRVAELMTIESYRRVHHIVSSIVGRLRRGTTAAEVLRAVFPGGTITGCPKIRSMQIIQELEQYAPRGAYTGACGYVSRHGRMDTNILIRTLVVRGNELRFRAGAGIVADSEPERELEETRHKARGLLEALIGPKEAMS